jgi:LAO/AO transport system kinase
LAIPSSSPEISPALVTLVERLKRSDAGALARCISLAEQGGPVADWLHRCVYPLTGQATVVGFTGPPGAGKSTLIDAFVDWLRKQGRTVAVAAVDPSSSISGGSVLGDRVRMQRHTEDPGVFIRSIASRGHLGGLSESIHRIVDLMDASRRDFVVIETVGTGQSEVEIAEVADVCVVLNAPNLGDDVQAIKAGVLEIADVLVVNKADLPLAGRTTDQLKAMLKLRQDRQDIPVVETVATTGAGVAELAYAIMERGGKRRQEKRAGRARRVRALVAQLAARRVQEEVLRTTDAAVAETIARAQEGEISLTEAADRIVRKIL